MHTELNILKIMPRARESRYAVLCQLKELSKEADHFTGDLSHEAALDAWFLSAKETVLKIKSCTSAEELANVAYPPKILSIFKQQNKSTEKVTVEILEKQKEHVHEEKYFASTAKKNESAKIKPATEIKNYEIRGSATKNNTDSRALQSIHIDRNTNTEMPNSKGKEIGKKSKNVLSPVKKIAKSQLSQESTPKIPIAYKNALQNTFCVSQELIQTPVANRTLSKILNTTITLDSSNKSNHSSKLVNHVNNGSIILSKSNSRTKVSTDKSSNGTHESDMHPKTRSHSKRKSSECKTGSNKKQKLEVHGAHVSATKAIKKKYPLIEKVVPSKVNGVSILENKAKISAVIVPSLQVKQPSMPSKEKQILEEIKKKEEKASENRKKVLAERQIKAEENKKKREEKQEKILQNRLQMEKKKEEKREMESKKSPIKAAIKEVAKKPAGKTRVKELIEQNAGKENKSGVLTSSKQNEVKTDVTSVPKTPTSQKSFDSENYELTPMPDSSTYDFSEDEEDKPPGKPIPLWAQGVHLKSALIQQFYYPANICEIFGTYIESPDLTEIFRVSKKGYKLRTSSANWHSPPARYLKK